MRIVLVEDNSIEAAIIQETLCRHLPGVEVRICESESEFIATFGRIAAAPPSMIILDVMLKWAKAGMKIIPQPAEVARDGLFRAGFRCQRVLATDCRTAGIPVVFYTHITKLDAAPYLPEGIPYLQKDLGDPRELVNLVRENLGLSEANNSSPGYSR